jgi:hypothetical protein
MLSNVATTCHDVASFEGALKTGHVATSCACCSVIENAVIREEITHCYYSSSLLSSAAAFLSISILSSCGVSAICLHNSHHITCCHNVPPTINTLPLTGPEPLHVI